MIELPVLESPLLARQPGVRHAFFTRNGGVSNGVYHSLNAGLGSHDDPGAVTENRKRAAAFFGLDEPALLTCYQIHSAITHTAAAEWTRPEGDGVAAAAPGLICAALSADCAPVLLADAEAGVVAAAHAGWKGALGGVVDAAVLRMEAMGAHRDRIVAAVGPCIGPRSYEVGADFQVRFEQEWTGARSFFRPGATADKRLFDLPGYVLARLERMGVAQAEWIGRDTCAEEELFFSNRRAFRRGEPDYGRLLSAIALA
jgi:YfiH family protein